jgi:hypothetical protein
MKEEPEVVATAQASGANVSVVSKTASGFTVGTDASSDTDVSFIAFNDNRA